MHAHAWRAALDRARAGDVAALGTLLEDLRPYVRVLVRALRPRLPAARLDESDLVQIALLEATREFPRFRGGTREELAGWLRQIAVRGVGHSLREHVGTARRAAGREEPVTDAGQLAGSASTPSEQAVRHEEETRLAGALECLPADMREVLLGRHVEELSYADLAARMGRTEGALRVLYVRALRRLREALGVGRE